jgi:hypothetical protein
MSNKNLGFWTGGSQAYEEGLKKDYQATVGKLKERLKEAKSEEERARIADELGQARKTYQEQLRRGNKYIF